MGSRKRLVLVEVGVVNCAKRCPGNRLRRWARDLAAWRIQDASNVNRPKLWAAAGTVLSAHKRTGKRSTACQSLAPQRRAERLLGGASRGPSPAASFDDHSRLTLAWKVGHMRMETIKKNRARVVVSASGETALDHGPKTLIVGDGGSSGCRA